jgi:hypothetical protein
MLLEILKLNAILNPKNPYAFWTNLEILYMVEGILFLQKNKMYKSKKAIIGS